MQYHVDDLAGEALLDDVGLDDAASAIIECGGGGEGFREEELGLALEVGAVGTAVAGVFLSVGAEEGTEGAGSLLPGSVGVGGAQNFTPFRNGVLGN